jgi:hypothetical protein
MSGFVGRSILYRQLSTGGAPRCYKPTPPLWLVTVVDAFAGGLPVDNGKLRTPLCSFFGVIRRGGLSDRYVVHDRFCLQLCEVIHAPAQ